jgi:hypothetical protein
MPCQRPAELLRTVILSSSAAGYPAAMARSPTETIRFLTLDEFARLLAVMRGHPRDRALFGLVVTSVPKLTLRKVSYFKALCHAF